jgi:hypothetical protein
MFMYFGKAYILSWDETIAFYKLLGILITYEWKTVRQMKISAHLFMKTRYILHWYLDIIILFFKPRLHVMKRPYEISLLINNFTN